MSAPAAYATAPTPGVVHEAATIGKMGRVLGTALMPWQHQVARVATERRRDGRGWRYPVVVLTVPRQSGKTTLMRAVMAQRTLRYPGHRAFYTAQTGKDARDRWKDLADAAQKQFPQLVTIRRGAGAECVEWKNGGGQIRTFAPTRDAIHGSTPHLVMLDEAFALDEELGASLMGGIVGSQAALGHERQIWIVSTAGDAESTWFRAWVEKGREAVGDPLAALAYFEWSAPDHLDLTDPASFPLFHPAVGHTQDAETIAANAETMSRAQFERAFGNRWVAARTTVISVDDWRATINREQNPPGPDASDLGLIPACAGKTLATPAMLVCLGAHPRVCGENLPRSTTQAACRGSSPRVRGKQRGLHDADQGRRLIPACAGKTPAAWALAAAMTAHPRVCGENAAAGGDSGIGWSSSPRVRGKPHPDHSPPLFRGLIPACAGKTGTPSRPRCSSTAHPRVCGENVTPSGNARPTSGSSPRVRGKRTRVSVPRP